MAQPKQTIAFTTMMTTLSSLLVLLVSISISDSYSYSYSSTRHAILPPLSIRKMTTMTTSRYKRNCRPLAMTTTTTTDEEDMEFAEGFGVGEKTLGIRDLINSQEDISVAMPDADLVQPAAPIMPQEQQQQEPLSSSRKDDDASVAENTRTLSPKAVLRFLAPTMALWIAPPIMSLIDTSAVGRFCGPTELAGMCTVQHSTVGSLVYMYTSLCIVGSVFTPPNRYDSLTCCFSLSLSKLQRLVQVVH
jgi:hypothetical protein